MTIFDELGCRLTLDKENGELNNDDSECYNGAMVPCITDGNATGNLKEYYVDCMDNSSPEMIQGEVRWQIYEGL